MKQLMENWRRHLAESEPSADQWVDATLDWIYSQLPEGGLEQQAPMIVAALQEVIQTLESQEANPEDGGMYGEEGFNEAITLDIEIGDIVLGGKYKNKRIEVKEIGTDDIGQPTINGKSLLKFRIEKQLPDEKKSKKTLDMERDEGGKSND